MPRATLSLSLPDGVWVGDVSRAYPEARFRILAALADDDEGVGLIEVVASNPRAVVKRIESHDAIVDLDVLRADEERALVQFETTHPLLLFPAQGSGVPLEMPFDIRDGEAIWEVTAPRDRLSELGDQLEAFGIPFTVERIERRSESDRVLTERQRRVVKAAVERGYYDTPRGTSLTDLAEALGIAKSTCSEILHRAEERIVKRFVDEGAIDVDAARG